MDELVDVVDLAAVPRHQVDQGLVAPLRVVVGRAPGRHLPDVRRQVAEEGPDHLEGLLLGVGQVVDASADARVDVRAAEVVLRDVVAECGLHHRRSAREELARVLHHHVEVRETGMDRRPAGDGAHHRRHDGYLRQHVDIDQPPGAAVRQVRAADLLEVPYAPAGGVEEADEGHFPLPRPFVRRKLRAHAAPAAAGTPPYGEVAGRQHDLPSVHAGRALDDRARDEGLELVVLVGPLARQRVELAERSVVHEAGNALARRQLAVPVLTLDAFRTAHPLAQATAPFDFGHFRAPAPFFHLVAPSRLYRQPAMVT